MFDSKMELLRFHFGIKKLEDWQEVLPASILSVDGVGPQTLNQIRLHLAGKGLTLRDDETPAYWQSHLFESRIGTVQLSDEDRSAVCPFTILVDSQEKHPFTFQGITADAADGKRPLIVGTKVESLGPSHGDYSIAELNPGDCHIERKSIDDAIGTILGWGDRRDRFQNTLSFLASCSVGVVIVEGSFGSVIASVKETRGKTKQENQKILHRQVIAWQTDYPVPWIFCDTRRMAELTTFQVMRRRYSKHLDRMKQSGRKTKKENA